MRDIQTIEPDSQPAILVLLCERSETDHRGGERKVQRCWPHVADHIGI